MDLEECTLNLIDLPNRAPVLVRTQAGATVLLTIALTDIKVENGAVVLIGDLDEVPE